MLKMQWMGVDKALHAAEPGLSSKLQACSYSIHA